MDEQTGSIYYRDEAGALWEAQSWQKLDGEVYTVDVLIEPSPEPEAESF